MEQAIATDYSVGTLVVEPLDLPRLRCTVKYIEHAFAQMFYMYMWSLGGQTGRSVECMEHPKKVSGPVPEKDTPRTPDVAARLEREGVNRDGFLLLVHRAATKRKGESVSRPRVTKDAPTKA